MALETYCVLPQRQPSPARAILSRPAMLSGHLSLSRLPATPRLHRDPLDAEGRRNLTVSSGMCCRGPANRESSDLCAWLCPEHSCVAGFAAKATRRGGGFTGEQRPRLTNLPSAPASWNASEQATVNVGIRLHLRHAHNLKVVLSEARLASGWVSFSKTTFATPSQTTQKHTAPAPAGVLAVFHSAAYIVHTTSI